MEWNRVGLSDPYCSIWISSNRQKFQDTSMKPKTLDPVWNETMNLWVNFLLSYDLWLAFSWIFDFSFISAVKDVNEDILQLEIW